jgi:integrase/recombinase XerD
MTTSPWPNKDPMRCCMKLEFWPEIDRIAWRAARAPGNVLDGGGPASHWRSATVTSAENSYGRYLTWLGSEGLLDPNSRPLARVTPDNVAGYIDTLRKLNGSVTLAKRVAGLLDMVRVLEPGADVAWLDRICANLEGAAVPSRNKANLVVSTDQLVTLGFDTMNKAAQGRSALDAAALRQYGLMISLLALVPLRRCNFTTIRIGPHLRRVGEEFRLVFSGEEMKNHEPLEVPVPSVLTSALERHLAVDRPLLAAHSDTARARRRPPGDALWLSKFGSALSSEPIYQQIRALTRSRFGHAINLHLFRDCAATTIADKDPAHVGITRSVLGHGSDAASAKYYNQAGTVDAARQHQDVVSSLRGLVKGIGGPRRDTC